MNQTYIKEKVKPAPFPRHIAHSKKESDLLLSLKIIARNFKPVAVSNSVNLVNVIFLIVSSSLLVLGQIREGFFLGSVLFLNVAIGIIQDLRAKLALEKLQVLAAPRIIRLDSGGQRHEIMPEAVRVGDALLISIGDQIPADGTLIESRGIEINEALISGESGYLHKNTGEEVLAGSIVMAGSGILRVQVLPRDSYVARMTEKIKKYKANPSPIQSKLNFFIKYMSYLLLVIIVYVVAHGIRTNDLLVSMVRDIGALTGTLVPQGLVLSITVFFAYGAIKLLRENVLMQEINATEKLGRIKNLCLDKTGTLTERKPVLEETIIYDGNNNDLIAQLLAGYIYANRDNSEIAMALRAKAALSFSGEIMAAIPFSSDRKYGIAWLDILGRNFAAVLGAPDILVEYFNNEEEKKLVKENIDLFAGKAKRLILLADAVGIPPNSSLSGNVLKPLALFVLFDPLRPGVSQIISFFQDRGVRLRVISGDGPRTVQATAQLAGMKYADIVATGADMELWDDVEYEERVPAFHLFARVKPNQKEKIISLLKKGGYTAMVGDGANDALAIKKADLGVAMFDGAPATRQIAQVVLLDNNFSALPKGVAMAESVILNIELVVGVFFNKIVAGLALFLALAIMGYGYPLSPSDMTIINYFTIWLPIAYWTLVPVLVPRFDSNSSLMGKSLLFSALSGILAAIAAATIFIFEPYNLRSGDSNFAIMLELIALGYWYFILAPLSYGAFPDHKHRRMLGVIAFICIMLIVAMVFAPQLAPIFDLRVPGWQTLLITAAVTSVTGYLQFLIATRWFWSKSKLQSKS